MQDDPYVKEQPLRAGRRSWFIAAAIAALALLLWGAFVAGRSGQPTAAVVIATETPAPTPTPHVLLAEADVNGVHLYDDAEVHWLSFYKENEELLGEPLAGPKAVGASADCVVFQYYVVCHSDDPAVRGGAWEYVPLALGYRAQDKGGPVQLDAPIAPVAAAYVERIKSSGRDAILWIGRSISQDYCSGTDCVQAFERAVLRWPNRPDAGVQDIARAPLGERMQ